MPSRDHYGHALDLGDDLWRVPFALCLAAVLLFLVTVEVDRAAARSVLSLPRWISIGGPEDARAILGALLGAVSTVLALIFSVALLVLSMAVSQFGPRMLYRFVRDGITQVTIGLFLATFVHMLLAFVVTRQQGKDEFVPELTLCCSGASGATQAREDVPVPLARRDGDAVRAVPDLAGEGQRRLERCRISKDARVRHDPEEAAEHEV